MELFSPFQLHNLTQLRLMFSRHHLLRNNVEHVRSMNTGKYKNHPLGFTHRFNDTPHQTPSTTQVPSIMTRKLRYSSQAKRHSGFKKKKMVEGVVPGKSGRGYYCGDGRNAVKTAWAWGCMRQGTGKQLSLLSRRWKKSTLYNAHVTWRGMTVKVDAYYDSVDS